GLARAVGADQDRELALLDPHVDAAQRRNAAVMAGKFLDLDERHDFRSANQGGRSDATACRRSMRSRCSEGTMPLGRKIIPLTRITPNRKSCQSSKPESACGNSVSSAAPTAAPKVEAMPPTTTMVTNSTERRKPASSGVMKRSALANSEPLSAAMTAESTKMRALSAAVSRPAVCAAISESASARRPRPNA